MMVVKLGRSNMKRLLILCVLPLILAGCTNTTIVNNAKPSTTTSVIETIATNTTITTKSTTPASQPDIVAKWSGTGIKTTDSFTITDSKWDIQWSSDPEMMNGTSVGMLQIYVFNVKNTSIPVTVVANTSQQDSDDSYIYQSGTFYLTIGGANTTWTVNVLEYK